MFLRFGMEGPMRQGLTDGAPFAQECLGLGGEISLSKPFKAGANADSSCCIFSMASSKVAFESCEPW